MSGLDVAFADSDRALDIMRLDSPEQVPPAHALHILWRRKLQVFTVFVLTTTAALVVIHSLRPYYDATAILMVDTRQSSFRDLQATVAPPDSDLVAIATQVGIMKSPSLAATVVDRLDLTRVPEFARQLDAPPGPVQRALEPIAHLFGLPEGPSKKLSESERRQLTAALLENAVTFVNDSKSYIISVRSRTSDPKLSADIANTFVAAFLDDKQAQKVDAIHRANGLLEEQLPPLEERVTIADQAVETYRAEHGLILNSIGDEGALAGTVADQQLAQVNSQLLAAKRELSRRQASLIEVREAQRTGRLDAATDVIGSPVIAGLRAQQAQLASRTASLAQGQASLNPILLSAQAAESGIQSKIAAEVERIARSVASQVASAQAQVNQLNADLLRLQGVVAQESKAAVTLRQLQSKARAERAIYQDYLGRFEASLNQSNLQVADAAQVSAAEPPIGKSGPPRGLYSAVAALASAALAIGLALLMERLRGGVRTLSELEAHTGLYGLGFAGKAPRNLRRVLKSGRPSAYLESINLVGDLLRFGRTRHRAQVVLVTSAAPAEGKTVFAVSLAASVGASGGAALLIDCDLRRPSVARFLRAADTSVEGGASPIMGTSTTVRRNQLPGVDVVTFSGEGVDKFERDTLAELKTLIGNAREHYDLVVLDAPPVLPFPDAPKLSLEADGTIVVVRWRHTPSTMVVSAVRALAAYGANIVGGVVTQVKDKEVATSDGGHSRFYRHYATYLR